MSEQGYIQKATKDAPFIINEDDINIYFFLFHKNSRYNKKIYLYCTMNTLLL